MFLHIVGRPPLEHPRKGKFFLPGVHMCDGLVDYSAFTKITLVHAGHLAASSCLRMPLQQPRILSNPIRRIQQPSSSWPPTQSRRSPIGAPAGGAVDAAGGVVEHDAIHTTSDLRHHLDVMPAHAQLVAYGRGDTRFHFEGLALRPDTWSLNGFLQSHAVINDVDDALQHGGEDTRTTRGAEGHEGAAAPEYNRGGHAAQHAFARRNGVGP